MDLVEHVKEAFLQAEMNQSKVTDEILKMEGMTGKKTRHFYNNLLNKEGIRYLEIGVYKGSSTCAAMCGNKAEVICVDNWSECGGIKNKNEFISNFNKFKGENDAKFIEKDCFKLTQADLFQGNEEKFNIYMYDGPHQKNNHYNALKYFLPYLDDTFIFIVDDWNWRDVRDGTKQALKDTGLKILYEHEVRLTFDNSVTPRPALTETWWNGIYFGVFSKL